MTHCSPDGNLWVPWLSEDDSARATIRGKITSRSLIGDILDEPEVRSRFAAMLGRTQTKKTPPLSDIQPYSSLIYMRDGFGKDCSSLMLLNFPVRSQTQGWGYNMKRGHIVGCMRTGFNVARDAKSVLEGSSILVDSKPPNIFVDLTPSGGKTDYCFQTPRNVQPGRFLSTGQFDVSESIQDSPYRRFQFGFNREMLGLDQSTPDAAIRDVRAFRQVFHLKNESIFIVGDRIENKGGERDFAQMYIVPLRVLAPYETDRLRLLANKEGALLEIAPEAKRVRSLSPGLPNVSLYLAGHNFEWGGRCTGEKTFEPVSSITAKALYEKVLNAGAEKEQKKILDASRVKPVSVRWRGEGNQALAAVVVTRPTQFDPALVGNKDISDFREMNGENGIVGFSFRSSAGTEVWFQTAPALASRLTAGPGQTVGGSLLVTRRDGQLAGVVMDAESVNLNGKEYKGSSAAFEFTLDKNGRFSAIPIGIPIDTVVISPPQTVFTDTLTVSFSIPTQKRDDIEYRYTLDGTDPNLQSTLYNGPFEISKDCRLKVRPFLKGLKETPWNIAGVEGGRTISAIFYKTKALPSVKADNLQAGLHYEYFEDSWSVLMSHSGMYPLLTVKSSGDAARLLDPDQLKSIRQTDRAYAVKYNGYMDVPATGVYRFFAPEPLYNTTKDAGYELRIWIDGKEWFPNPELHAENIWSVALEKGLHSFQVSYVDYRWKKFRNEYWMSWNPLQMWEGTPVLEMDGPGISKGPVPDRLFFRKK